MRTENERGLKRHLEVATVPEAGPMSDREDCDRPAKLSPQYLKAEEAYRKAPTPAERLEAVREMFRVLPRHKGREAPDRPQAKDEPFA